jgi:hypothetical protein
MSWPPLLMHLRMKGYGMPSLSLWIPLFLIWPFVAVLFILLSPFLLVLLLVAFFMFSVRLNPFELCVNLYQILCALRGLVVEVEVPRDRSLIEVLFR